MSDYVKAVDFAAKDALTTGDPLKVVKGTEIGAEFDAIATAVATKADLNSPAFTGIPLAPTPNGATSTQVANVSYVNTQAFASVPIGAIIMWGGQAGVYPSGWQLCDGGTYSRSDGGGNITTPDLRNKFIVASGSTYAEQTTGGSLTHTHTSTSAGSHTHGGVTGATTLTVAQMPAHTHSSTIVTTNESGAGNPWGSGGSTTEDNFAFTTGSSGGGQSHNHTISSDGDHNHTISTTSNVPPYFALAYLMKV